MRSQAFPLIDCDIHISPSAEYPLEPFIPAEFRQAIAQGQASKPTHGYANPSGVARRDVDLSDPFLAVRRHLDQYNIVYGVLQPYPGLDVSMTHCLDVGNAMARACNDWQIETALAYDERLLGSVCINLQDPAAAAAEIRRVGGHPRMVQTLGTGEGLLLYGHRFYHPVYEACEEMGLTFALHPGAEGMLNRTTPVGRPSSYFEWHNSLPLAFMGHVNSLVVEGTFEKFPGLKVLIVEAGISWLVNLMWRMDKNFKGLRVTTPWLRQAPSEYVFEHIRLTTQPIEEPANPNHLLQIFDMIRAERTLCFSTDFPHWDFDDPHHAFPSRTPVELLRRIQYGNAAELFRLPSLEETEARLQRGKRRPRRRVSPESQPVNPPGSGKALDEAFRHVEQAGPPKARTDRTLTVCKAAELPPGSRRIVQDGTISIGVFNIRGAFHAIRNFCPHQGAPLCAGSIYGTYRPSDPQEFEPTLEDRVIRCPWHGWEFDIVSGKGLFDRKTRVATYEARVDAEGNVVVFL